jgi:hypothetical protein
MIEYTWMVYRHSKVIGKIISFSSWCALSEAQKKYGGDGIWLEMLV